MAACHEVTEEWRADPHWVRRSCRSGGRAPGILQQSTEALSCHRDHRPGGCGGLEWDSLGEVTDIPFLDASQTKSLPWDRQSGKFDHGRGSHFLFSFPTACFETAGLTDLVMPSLNYLLFRPSNRSPAMPTLPRGLFVGQPLGNGYRAGKTVVCNPSFSHSP